MIKIEINRAEVSDTGYGLKVNDHYLEDIITLALGAKKTPFKNNCCDITVTINPMPKTAYSIDTGDGGIYQNVDALKEDKDERVNSQNEETTTEN